MNIEELRKKRKELSSKSDETLKNMNTIANESLRVAEVAHNSKAIIDNLELEFQRQTGFNSLDVKFLFFATALQCVRQYWLSNEKGRFKSDQEAGRVVKKYAPISLIGPVPYDAFKKEGYTENTGISGANHRYSTLGHDPLLGWIFGTANILSETVTKNNILLESYNTVLVGNEYKIQGETNIGSILGTSIDRIQEDYKDLILAVTKHAVHLSSDAFTTMGLPIPIINNISPDLSSKLLKNGIDTYSVSRGIALSSLINMIVASIHGLFYDATKHRSRDIYEVKTRKILSYSNTIASASNVIVVAIGAAAGASSSNPELIRKSLRNLDVGGLMVTIYRLLTDSKFIREVKEEFVLGNFNKLIQGEEYNF
jgi:hypothetical protein